MATTGVRLGLNDLCVLSSNGSLIERTCRVLRHHTQQAMRVRCHTSSGRQLGINNASNVIRQRIPRSVSSGRSRLGDARQLRANASGRGLEGTHLSFSGSELAGTVTKTRLCGNEVVQFRVKFGRKREDWRHSDRVNRPRAFPTQSSCANHVRCASTCRSTWQSEGSGVRRARCGLDLLPVKANGRLSAWSGNGRRGGRAGRGGGGGGGGVVAVHAGGLIPFIDSWQPSIHSESIAPQLFAISLFPYLGFLYHLTRSGTAPRRTLFGFYFLLAFVGATIPAGIYAKVHYGTSLSNVDWLHGSAESLLTITNLLIVSGLRSAIRDAETVKEEGSDAIAAIADAEREAVAINGTRTTVNNETE